MELSPDPLARPRWHSAALLTIDVQNDFTLADGAARVAGTEAVIPQIVRLLDAFRTLRRPIVHVVRFYARDGSDAELSRRTFVQFRGPVVAPETLGAELVAALKPDASVRLDSRMLLAGERQQIGPREWVMYKSRWGAFYRTGLEAWLAELGVDTAVVCGCNFPNCPRATLVEASERDLRSVIVRDATSQTHERGLAELTSLGVSVLTTQETLAAFNSADPVAQEHRPLSASALRSTDL